MKPQEDDHLIDGTLVPVEARKLKVVSLPTRVVQYCRQPGGGLEIVLETLMNFQKFYNCPRICSTRIIHQFR